MPIMPKEYQDEVNEFNKLLKKQLQQVAGADVKISVGRLTASKQPNPYIEFRLVNWQTDVIPNSFRLFVLDNIFPNANCLNRDNVCYGNIRSNRICLNYLVWKKLNIDEYLTLNK